MKIELRISKVFSIVLLLQWAFFSAFANTYYVATDGDNSRSSTEAQNEETPWRTIQKAANEVRAGDVVIIAGGTYNEYITLPASCSGTADNYITFKSKEGETAIINGVGGWNWIALIDTYRSNNDVGNDYLRFEGLRLQNSHFFGFKFESSNHIYVENCHTYHTGGSGIYFRNSRYIHVYNNKVEKACLSTDERTNSQECITLANGRDFEVVGNEVWDGGSATGGEGIDVKGNSADGVISHNYVHDLARNRGGIYIDSWTTEARNIRIHSNLVERTHHGIMIAGEMGGYTREIYVYNNISQSNFENGFLMHQFGNGRFSDIYVENNTFYNNGNDNLNNTLAGDIWYQNNNSNNTNMFIRNNICVNQGSQYDFIIRVRLPGSTVVSNNLVYVHKPGTQATTGSNAIEQDPMFVNAEEGDFRLQSNSPAINAGTTEVNQFITEDYDGNRRPFDSGFDIGAFEFGSFPAPEPMLINGEFDDALNGWSTQVQNNAEASAAVITNAGLSGDYALFYNINNGGSDKRDVQLYQENIDLESSKDYTLSFMARALSNRSISVVIEGNEDPNNPYFERNFNLNTSVQTYSMNFSPTVTDSAAALKFLLGGSNANIMIDSVMLVEGDEGIVTQLQPELEEVIDRVSLNIYPNPSKGGNVKVQFYVKEPTQVNLRVINLMGKEYYSESMNISHQGNQEFTLQRNAWPSGLYLLILDSGLNSYTKKLLVE